MLWENAVVTNAGLLLLQQVLEGRRLFLDYAMGGTGTYPPETLKSRTSLLNQKQQFPIIQQKNVHNGKQVGALITNFELPESYMLTQYGIFAHIEGGPVTLLAILQDSEGLKIPSRTEIPEFHFVFYVIIDFSNEAIWEFTIDPILNRPRLEMTDPTPTTPGAISQFYTNVDTGSVFQCIDTRYGVFTWLQLIEGGIASGAAILGASHFGAAYLMERT